MYMRKRRPIRHKITFTDVALNLTFRCNLACVGCDRASFIKPEHSPPMTVARLGAFLEDVKSVGVELKRIRLVGGEPTLHPEFFALAQLCMDYTRSIRGRCNVRIFSNRHTPPTRSILAECARRWPDLQQCGRRKFRSTVFPKMTRYEYVSPKDAGIDCPFPCPNMASRGKCGAGVDETGIFLCPTGSPINSILDLGVEAKSVKQMLDEDFVHWQSKTLCSVCGQFMAYTEDQLPRLWDCNGTPVSETYYHKLKQKGFLA